LGIKVVVPEEAKDVTEAEKQARKEKEQQEEALAP
jgi:hypothetical protein